jgi:hypothetical protein
MNKRFTIENRAHPLNQPLWFMQTKRILYLLQKLIQIHFKKLQQTEDS